jgi:O-methyltransferase involved in polyketide biosynthesis
MSAQLTNTSNQFDAISSTAMLIAYARQFTDIPYSQAIAQIIPAQAVAEQLLHNRLEMLGDMVVLFEARYKAINHLLARSQFTQIFELASGLLPRGMVMSCSPAITFIESDLPAMLNDKQQIVKQLVGERANLHFSAIDVTRRPNPFPLNAPYLDPTAPVAILCEGLLMYLTQVEKQQVFANVREMLQMFGGMWITPDLITKDHAQQLRQVTPAIQALDQAIQQTTGRSIATHHFEDWSQLQHVASQAGFRIEGLSLVEVFDQLTCLTPLGLDPRVALKMLETRFVWMLSLP